MNDCVRGLACSLLFTALLPAQPAANAGLPVKRVVLYKNGVGYFELQGRVQGNQDVAIPFTSGRLNDVLKSLTVLDLGGGRITGVGYGSSAPLDRQLGDLRLPLAERGNLNDFLGALRGARVEIRPAAPRSLGVFSEWSARRARLTESGMTSISRACSPNPAKCGLPN